MSFQITGNFLKETIQYFEQLPDIAAKAASMSINQIVERKGLAMMRKDMESQVNFPSGYLDSPDRFGVTRKASPNSLEAVITARDRPTSLARFASGQTPENTRGKTITVQVKKGKSVRLSKAFMVRMRNGNIGLAIRLKPGDSLRNHSGPKPVMLAKNVYLLYAPSVDQVFKTVAAESVPELGNMVTSEFYRQFARLSRGR